MIDAALGSRIEGWTGSNRLLKDFVETGWLLISQSPFADALRETVVLCSLRLTVVTQQQSSCSCDGNHNYDYTFDEVCISLSGLICSVGLARLADVRGTRERANF